MHGDACVSRHVRLEESLHYYHCGDIKMTNGDQRHYGCSREYWIGWAAAYYQWYSGRKYSDIFKAVSFWDMQKMYYTLHEAGITKFVDIVDSRMREYFSETNLKRIRTVYGCTQIIV